MSFEFKKVKCSQHGGCYACTDSLKHNKDTDEFIDKYEFVNSFTIKNSVIRLCDEHLKQLIEEGNEILEEGEWIMYENIKERIKSMSVNGLNHFRLLNTLYKIEFKLFEIGDVEFLAISGGGVSLLTFFKHQVDSDIDYVMDEINKSVFKGIDLNIEDSLWLD